MHDEMSRLVRTFYERCWNDWDDSAVDAVLAPGFSFRGSLGLEALGLGEWRAYRDSIRAAAPDFRNEVVTLVTNGDRAAARLRYSGTQTGPLLGIPPTGRQFNYAGAVFFTAADGLLTEAWAIGDLDELRGQLMQPL